MDSKGYGEPLISYDNSANCLNQSVKVYGSLDQEEKNQLEGLLIRYNETLNLPYTYERAEAYWRIIEWLGDENLPSGYNNEYERLKNIIGIKKDSRNLKKFIKTILDHNIKYTDQEITDSFNFRNVSMHEYLNIKKINAIKIPLVFLNNCVEIIILSRLKIDMSFYIKQSFCIIQNRIV